MGGQLWSIEKDVDVKRIVTKHIVKQAPNCCGKPILLMTSRTYTDFIELVKQGKINGDSTIFNIENLKSKHIIHEKEKLNDESDIQAFSRLWEKEINEICDSLSIDHVHHSLHFPKEIFNMSLYHLGQGNPFEFVYADTCNKPIDKFFTWINSYSTYAGIADDGVLMVTLVLDRMKSMKSLKSCKNYDDKLIMLSTGNDKCHGYKNLTEENKYMDWMSAIAEKVESKNLWLLKEMIHYREKSKHALNMAVAIFKKIP